MATAHEFSDAEQGGRSPYLGLAAYGEADAERFFGRDRLVTDLVAQLREEWFIAVFGPSGSGKSSLLRAGVIPAARDAGGVGVTTTWLTPGAHPMAALAQALPSPLAVDRWAEGEDELLLVVDQFEEVFTLCTDPRERSAFIDVLLTARRPGSKVRVMLGMRADYYGHCGAHPGLAAALRAASVLVAPLTASELRDVVVKPAAKEHVTVEPALVAMIIAEAGDEPGMLPLVSHALRESWRRRRGKTLTLHAYQTAGGIHGAIAQTAETLYTSFTTGQQEMVRRILQRLIIVGDGTLATRRPLDRSDLLCAATAWRRGEADGAIGLVLDRLAQARLVTLDETTVQLAHEAVITAWPRLRGWLDSDREGMRIRQQLTDAAMAWEQLHRDPGSLYRGTRLAVARDWAERDDNDAALTALERAFLRAGLAALETERTVVRRRARRLRALAATLAVLLVVAVGAGVTAERQRRIVDQQRRLAQSRELAGQANATGHNDLARAARLAVQAFRSAPTAQARGALLSTAATPRHNVVLNSQTGPVTAIALSHDGRLLASGSAGSVVLWDTARANRRLVIPAANAPGGLLPGDASAEPREARSGVSEVEALAFSADGRLLAVSSHLGGGRRVRVWDIARRVQIAVRDGNGGKPGPGAPYPPRVAFSPDGRRIAVKDDQKVIVWDLSDSGWSRVYQGRTSMTRLRQAQGDWLRSAGKTISETGTGDLPSEPPSRFPFELFPGYSRGGRVLAIPHKDGLLVTDARTGRHLFKLSKADLGSGDRWQLSPDGRVLYTVDRDGGVSMWDVPHRLRMVALPGLAGAISDMTVSRDGHLFACAGNDGTIRVWNLAKMALIGHSAAVKAIAYSPDGRTLASAGGADSTVRLWDPDNRTVRAVLRADPDQHANAIAYSPDATMLAVGGDRSVQLWKIADQCRPRPCGIHRYTRGAAIKSLAFSPDGKQLAAVDVNGTVTLTDTRTHQRTSEPANAAAYHPGSNLAVARGGAVTLRNSRLPAFTGIGGSITSVAFSPDGNLLATTGQDSNVQLWDTHQRTRTGALTGHTAPPRTIAFSPDGRLLATAGRDRTIIIWNLARRAPWAILTGHTDTITGLAFHPNGKTLASASADHTLALWPLDTTTALTTLCSRFQPSSHC